MARLRFGYFIAPFHRAGTNPTLALQRDLEFAEHLDALGFDEVWYGEHHSAGSEIISSPEIFIAAAAQRAKRIRFGTGVISLAYHNPLWVADRLMLLDHLTHGRVIGGMGPGSLPTDSAMIGLTPTDTIKIEYYYSFLWRWSQQDAVYIGAPWPGAQGQNSYAVTALLPGRAIGRQSDLRLAWTITPHLLSLFEFGLFWPGAALRAAGGRTTTFLDANLTFKF